MMKKAKDGDVSANRKISALKKMKLSVRQLNDDLKSDKKLNAGQTKRVKRIAIRRASKNAARSLGDSLRTNNPFDIKTSKLHFDVINRKVKGTVGRPTVSRRKGIVKRYTLLSDELNKLNRKGGGVIDRRIGELSGRMSEEDKIRARFAKERKRNSKANIYNLEQEELTHLGQSLSLDEDYEEEEIGFNDDDEEASGTKGNIDYEQVSSANFGGFELKKKSSGSSEPSENLQIPKKSRDQIISEIIENSILRKEERRNMQEENMELISEVDEKISLINKLFSRKSSSLPTKNFHNDNSDPQYDSYIFDLSSEPKTKPRDPLLTEKQRAELEIQKLKALEKKNNRALFQNSSYDTQNPDAYIDTSTSSLEKKHNDTPDSIAYIDGKIVQKHYLDPNDYASDESESDESESDASESYGSASNDPMSEALMPDTSSFSLKEASETVEPSSELPCTFDAPQTLSDVTSIFKNRSIEQCENIIQRIRTLYNPTLGSRKPLEKFTELLIEYLYYYYLDDSHLNPLETLPIFVQIVELGRQFEDTVDAISRKKFKKLLASPSDSVPNTSDCLLFSIVLNVHSNDINSPAVMLGLLAMTKYISQNIENTPEHIFKRLWIIDIIIDLVEVSHKYIPELISAVLNSINNCTKNSLISSNIKLSQDISHFNRLFHVFNSELVQEQQPLTDAICINRSHIQNMPILIFLYSLKCLNRIIQLYSRMDGFDIVFTHISSLLESFSVEDMSDIVKSYYLYTLDQLKMASNYYIAKMGALKLQKKFKVSAIKMETPKFFDDYSLDSKAKNSAYSSNKERSRLTHIYKREKRGAIRDLRRDAAVLGDIKSLKKERYRLECEKKMKIITGQLAQQEGEERSFERKKRRFRL